jgi:4-diphosphocytidyl-2-C-methyl-D-erythritol kinase
VGANRSSGASSPHSARTTIAGVHPTTPTINVRVPAKINIYLGVGPLRPDGFHELTTIFQALELFDTVTARPAQTLSVTLAGPESTGLPADERNLAWQAAAALAEHWHRDPAVALHIDKAIPVAAGLAGGSADAAGALAACDALWQTATPASVLDGLAANLGSDVTFALHGGTALGTGRGEKLQPVAASGEFHWVLAAADGQLSTPAVYRELDQQRATGATRIAPADPAAVIEALSSGDVLALAAALGNDLQPAALALAPQLAATLAAGQESGALAGFVSGSGPSCVFLARDRTDAGRLSHALAVSGSCRFALAVRGNVGGAVRNVRERVADAGTDGAAAGADGADSGADAREPAGDR